MEELLDMYERLIRAASPRVRPNHDPKGLTLDHALSMVDTMQSWLYCSQMDQAKTMKFMRWLGWLQCLMAMHGIRTMEQMREDNRDGLTR